MVNTAVRTLIQRLRVTPAKLTSQPMPTKQRDPTGQLGPVSCMSVLAILLSITAQNIVPVVIASNHQRMLDNLPG